MEFKLKQQNQGVKYFTVADNHFLINSLNGLYLDNNLVFGKNDEFNICEFVGNNFLFYGNLNFYNILNLKSGVVKEINPSFSYYWNTFNGNRVLVSNNRRKNELGIRVANYYWFDINENILSRKLFQIKPQNYIFNNNLFTTEKHILSSLSLLTGDQEWELDLGGRSYILGGIETENRIVHFFGVINHYLYVWMADNRLVEIDIASGKIKTESHPLEAIRGCNFDSATAFIKYRESEESAFVFNKNFLVQLHLPTQVATLLWQDERYNIGPSFISDQYIFFIGNGENGTFFRDHIGVFDRKKNEVVWTQQVIELSKATYNNLKEIQATEDKIYVLDTAGNLFVFEKSE